MASLDTNLRNARLTQLQTALSGGRILLCSGTAPAAPWSPALPAAGNILSEHTLPVSPGTIDNGVWTLADSDLAQDATANNTGVPTFWIGVSSTNVPRCLFRIPTESTLTWSGGQTQINAGQPADILSLVVTEGDQ